MFNIPSAARELSEATPQVPVEPNGLMQGRNDAGGVGCTGPKPPPGKPHHYRFRLFALDQFLDLPADTNREGLRDAINGHLLGEADLTGTYELGQQEGVTDNPFEKKALQDVESLHTAPLA